MLGRICIIQSGSKNPTDLSAIEEIWIPYTNIPKIHKIGRCPYHEDVKLCQDKNKTKS